MAKKDLKAELKELYFPSSNNVSEVDVPQMMFATVDGQGNPNEAKAFQEALQALYGVSYTLMFSLKKAKLADYTVMPLEALWWTHADGRFDLDAKEEWKWTAMLLQPEVVTQARFQDAVAQLKEKRDSPAVSKLRLEPFHEGRAAQILHIGPYSAERPTIERVHNYIREHGYKLSGKHHEIYLGDPRRAAPEKLKTVVRQPMRK